MSSEATVRFIFGQHDRAYVFHKCGRQMQHLFTYGGDSMNSDWWCNECLACVMLKGDDIFPYPLEPTRSPDVV